MVYIILKKYDKIYILINNKDMHKLISLFILIISLSSCCSKTNKLISLNLLPEQLAKASPGDTLWIKDGEYKDILLDLEGYGDFEKPIVVCAQNLGNVYIEGESSLRLCGEYVEIRGFYFRNGYSPQGAIIEYRSANNEKVAKNCRVTESTIYYFNPESRSSSSSWIMLFGSNNRFDHNTIIGKLNNNVTLSVNLEEERDRENNHLIDNNYFGERPILGSNGGETIRVGNSHTAFFSSNTVIENNLFDQCDGEVEVVSIKSSHNIIRKNTFLECAGVLALRHGNYNSVEDNVFIGNDKPNTGGIRIVNEGHIINNNFFYKLRGDRFFATLGLMNAVPNSLPNRYHHVKNVIIEENQFIDCDHILFGVGKDNERTLPPENIIIKKNIFISNDENKKEVYVALDNIDGFTFIENIVDYKSRVLLPGFVNTTNSNIDISNKIKQSTQKDEYGASWFKIEEERIKSGKVITVNRGQSSLLKAVNEADNGDIIFLAEGGEYWVDSTICIDKKLKIEGNSKLETLPVLRFNGIQRSPFITIMNGGELEVVGIAFDGEVVSGKSMALGGISTSSLMITPYLLEVNNCEFYNFYESNLAAIRGLKSTFSPIITIKNSFFHDMSGEAINYAGEKDDVGKYNVENLNVENCKFLRIMGSAINLYRGGNDESTSGPSLNVENSVFNNVDNKEQGSVLRLIGVQKAQINKCTFINSGQGGAIIRFNEMRWDKLSLSNIDVSNSGRISSFWDNIEKRNIKIN